MVKQMYKQMTEFDKINLGIKTKYKTTTQLYKANKENKSEYITKAWVTQN